MNSLKTYFNQQNIKNYWHESDVFDVALIEKKNNEDDNENDNVSDKSESNYLPTKKDARIFLKPIINFTTAQLASNVVLIT